MPFRMLLSNPITLAALAAIAIGVITYQIVTKNNRRRLPASGRRHSRDSGYTSEGPHNPGNDRKGPNKPNNRHKGPGKRGEKPDKSDEGFTGPITDAGDGTGALSKAGNSPIRSEEPGSDPNGLRRRANASNRRDDTIKSSHLPVDYNDVNSSLSSLDRNSKSPSDINNQNRNVRIQDNENQKVEGYTKQGNVKTTEFVPNISDIDSDSDTSESNNSQESVKTNYSSTEANESVCDNESSCINEAESIRSPSPIDSEEEFYKRKVCDHLKSHLESESWSSISEDFNDESFYISGSGASASTGATNILDDYPRKPKMCKGCLEELANAVAYPCKHCYLCLDCAVKVHRIYKKCSICQSVIKTFEQSNA